ncbi:hypothetical protein GCM10023223_45210 [Stackebrandtia albiflava]
MKPPTSGAANAAALYVRLNTPWYRARIRGGDRSAMIVAFGGAASIAPIVHTTEHTRYIPNGFDSPTRPKPAPIRTSAAASDTALENRRSRRGINSWPAVISTDPTVRVMP